MEIASLNVFAAAVEGCHWRWRHQIASSCRAVDPDRFGVVATYLLGSTKNATAGPESDIDILIHFRGTESQRKELTTWLQGWSLCLSEINYLITGHKTRGLLDIHMISDLDIKNRTAFAVRIGAVTDAAKPLATGPGIRGKRVRHSNPVRNCDSRTARTKFFKSAIRNLKAVLSWPLRVFPD